MSKAFEVRLDQLEVDPRVTADLVVHKTFRPFVEGTEPLKQKAGRSWTFHLGVLVVLLLLFALLNRAIFSTDWGWAESFPVFFVMILLPFIALMWAIYVWAAFRERNSPVHPSHLLVGSVTKRGRASKGGSRNYTIEYQAPQGGLAKLVSPQVGNKLTVGQQVVVLYFDRKKSIIL